MEEIQKERMDITIKMTKNGDNTKTISLKIIGK